MKIITLNSHSIVEKNYNEKLNIFVDVILKEKPDIFALQEVNQSIILPEVAPDSLKGYVPCTEVPTHIREDNHALKVANLLRQSGLPYEWVWIPLKVGYGKYDEGIAIFSLSPIVETRQFYISNIRDYNNWKTRKILGIKTKDTRDVWFYSSHYGWWDDEEEPFKNQWDITDYKIKSDLSLDELCYILGDFNAPCNLRGESYDYVKNTGWLDTWELAENKDEGITVGKVIDGWRHKLEDASAYGMRLDYIWCNKNINVKLSKVICNGDNYDVVSDHYGVMIEIEDGGLN